MALRIIFMGTPEFAVPTLNELVGQGHEVVAVYSQPPRPAGRGMAERLSAVHEQAKAFGIPVNTPLSLKETSVLEAFQSHDADLVIVIAYGQILPQAYLDIPRLGCLNGHASLLPRWRGAAPIQRAIMAGDTASGVSIMQMETGLDTGPVALVEKAEINDETTAGELHDRLAALTADLFLRAVSALERGTLVFSPQANEGITYAEKIDKQEARIDFRLAAKTVIRHVHGLSPFPGAWCEIFSRGKPVRLKVLRCVMADGEGEPGSIIDGGLTIACGTGSVRLLKVQRAGKQAQSAEEFLRGNPIDTDQVLN